MYLSKLEIHGFKSFAQKTTLHFTDGLTGIVGPNGSGKTNIVDALRWVLGEQKSSVLRSDGMEQVIFNGTRTRRPLGMSEVSLTIENNKHILPTEFSQVVITRRLFRDGESMYMLNRTPCRLRDIIDLFTDTGMGADAYSVIELKMIEQILSDRTDDRRHLFEEAAGVVKYKQRRKETLRRLAATQNDLSRVQDIVREVQKAVGSLARQAEKAKSYSELTDTLKQLEVELLRREYADAQDNLRSISDDLQYAASEKQKFEKEIQKFEQALQDAEQRDSAIEAELAEAQEKERQASTNASGVQQELAVLKERFASMQRQLERTRQEQVDTKRQLERLKEEIELAENNMEQSLEQQESNDDVLRAAREERDTAHASVQELREKSRIASEPVLAIDSRMQFLVAGRDRIRRQVDSLHAQSQQLARQVENAEKEMQHVQTRIQNEEQTIIAAKNKVVELESALGVARTREHELHIAIEASQATLSEKRSELSHSKASLEFLQGIHDDSISNTFLLETPEWNVADKTVLAELLSVQDEYTVGVEHALGEAARYFVVQTKQDAIAARNALRSHDKGKAAFVCRELIPSVPQLASAPQGDGVIGWVSEIISTDDVIRNAVRSLLGRTILTSSLDASLAIIQHPDVECAVTVDGESIQKNGVLRGGAVSKTEGMRVGKQKRIAHLQEQIATLQQTIAEIEQQLSEMRRERSGINLHSMNDELRRAESFKSSLEQNISQLQYKLSSFTQTIEQHTARIQQLSQESADALHEDETIQKEMEELRSRKQEAQQVLQGKMEEMRNAEQHLSEKESTLRNAELQLVRTNAEIDSLESNLRRYIEQQRQMEERFEHSTKELETTKVTIKETEGTVQTKETEFNAVDEIFRGLRSERMSIEARALNAREEMHQANEAIRSQRVHLENAIKEFHALELKESQFKIRAEDLLKKANEELEIDLTEPFTLPEEALSLEEARTRVHQLKNRMQNMGNVNFMAMEEHDKELERLTLLKTQYEDLMTAEKNLQDTINEINNNAKNRFYDVFHKVRDHFKELFALLFNGDGEADLQMVGDDPLECHIEIIAKPKGKRPHSIEMLSGGEKTLTAIALLFAIYLVKPSPFCILDEVDAPLDDANIDRYLQLIRKFSENTQFLMITHNKKTMEAADTLYGVTMEEVGVSKMVSVQLRDGKETRKEVTADVDEEVVMQDNE
ncbi:MAG: chromosome segregation protein SMC [Candidatus Kapaibacterium sp.]|nr:chromosome segregation protein SMC [Bacteroidota bacterium]